MNANMFERVCTILGRLLVICKTLNDVVIPKANVFLRYGEKLFKCINLAGSEEERKQAMGLMSDLSGYSLSEQEFAEFMNGKKQIEL